jgi:hypothetical protein
VHTGFWWGRPERNNHLEDLGVDGRIILKWFFKNWNGETWTELMWLRIGQVDVACECSNEPSGSKKC